MKSICTTFIVMTMMAMSVTGKEFNKLEYFIKFYSYNFSPKMSPGKVSSWTQPFAESWKTSGS